MTIGVNNRNDAIGNGSTPTYSYGFKIFAATDLALTVLDPDSGDETDLVYPANYSVAGIGNKNGGSITLAGSGAWIDASGYLAQDWAITIRRVRPLTQQTDLRNQDRSYLPQNTEDQFDRCLMIDQQQQDELDRSLKLPETEVGSNATTRLPARANRVSKYLGFDGSGDLVAVAGTATPVDLSDHRVTALHAPVSFSLQQLASEEVHVKRWGGKGRGLVGDITNDTDAALAALAEVLDGDGFRVLVFDSGFWFLGDDLAWVANIPVAIRGAGMMSTWLYRYGGSSSGALRLQGLIHTQVSGDVWLSNDPLGVVSDLAVMSNVGPTISHIDASNLSFNRLWSIFGGASGPAWKGNGGFMNTYTDCFFGDSDLYYGDAVAALVSGHSIETWTMYLKPETHTATKTDGSTRASTRTLFTEHRFKGCKWGWSASVGVLHMENPDNSLYGSFDHVIGDGCKINLPAYPKKGIELVDVDVKIQAFGESADTNSDGLHQTGGTVRLSGATINNTIRTRQGVGHSTKLLIDGRTHYGRYFPDTEAIDVFHADEGSTTTVHPRSLSGAWDTMAVGNDFSFRSTIVDKAFTGTVTDGSYAGPYVRGDGVYNARPMFRLKGDAGGAFVESVVDWRMTSGGFCEFYDKTNNRIMRTFSGLESILSADKGDAAATLTVGASEGTSIWNTVLTADRAVALSATNVYNGAEFRVVRTAAATGAFNLNVGTGPLKALAAGQYCVVKHNGVAWTLVAFGSL